MIFSEDVLERNFGKYLCWAIIFIGLGFVIALRLSFLDEAYNDDEAKIKKLLVELNADLPREIGTIGIQDSITFENNTLIFHHTVQGGEMIKGFYEERGKLSVVPGEGGIENTSRAILEALGV